MPNIRPDANSAKTRALRDTNSGSSAPIRTPRRRTSREELSRHERETLAQRYLLIGMAALVALILAILGFGFWREYIARNSEPVATVVGRPLTLESYARKLDFRRKTIDQQKQYMQMQLQSFSGNESLVDLVRQQIQQLQFTQIMLPEQTLDQMIDEELIRQEAARRGLTVTAEEIDEETKNNFGDPPAAEAAPSPTADPSASAASQPTAEASPAPTAVQATPVPTADVQARLKEFLSVYGLSEAEYKQMVEVQVLYRKLEEAMGAEVTTTADQLRARHILVETEEKAKELVEKLRGGASFEELAKTESTDTGSKEKGGDLGWFTEGMMVPEFDKAVFQLEPNKISDPVNTTYGWHIIELLEKEQNRPLDEQMLNRKKSAALPDWLDKTRNGPEITRSLSEEKLNWVYQRIKWSPPY